MGDIEKRPHIFMGSFFLNHPPRQIHPWDHQPVLAKATQIGLYTGAAGTIISAINHGVIAPSEGNRGYVANVTKFGAMAAAIGFTFGGVSQMVASVRRESDPWNAVAGGCAAGFLIGVRAGQLPMAVGQCALWGAAGGGVHYAGNTLIPANLRKSKEQQQEERLKLLGNHKDPLLEQHS